MTITEDDLKKCQLDDRVRFTMLAEFGLVEFKDGACRLTETGKAAIACA